MQADNNSAQLVPRERSEKAALNSEISRNLHQRTSP